MVQRPLSLSGRRRKRAAGERLSELFEQHSRMVYGVCRLILRDATEAEDAAQQTFLSAYRGMLAGQEPREPSAWLGTIARNECRARLRGRSTEPLSLVTVAAGDETQREVGRRAEAEALCTALAELPAQQRDALVLREFYGLSYAEVAAALGLSGAAVESLLFRGRRRLQAQLRPLRSALGALVLPPTLWQSLAQALPGFGGGSASAGAGAGAAALAKLGGAPLAAKLAAVTLALGTAGTIAAVEKGPHLRAPRRAPSTARPAAGKELANAGASVQSFAVVAASGGGHAQRGSSVQESSRGDGSGDREQTSEGRTKGDSGSTEARSSEPENEGPSTEPATKPSGDDNEGSGSGSEDHHSGSGDGGGDGSGDGSGDGTSD